MKHLVIALLIAAGMLTRIAAAQSGTGADSIVVDIAAGYATVRANAQPGACGCFFMNGGSAEIAVGVPSGAALLFQFSETTASNINGGGHDLRLTTYFAGGRYSYDRRSRFVPFGQVLVGAAHSATNFSIDHATSTIAFATGGGLDFDVSPRLSLRLAEAEYLLTHVANGSSNEQNQLRLTAGVVFHIARPRRNRH